MVNLSPLTPRRVYSPSGASELRNFVKCSGISDQLPITNYQLPITNYQLPITNYPQSLHELATPSLKPIVLAL